MLNFLYLYIRLVRQDINHYTARRDIPYIFKPIVKKIEYFCIRKVQRFYTITPCWSHLNALFPPRPSSVYDEWRPAASDPTQQAHIRTFPWTAMCFHKFCPEVLYRIGKCNTRWKIEFAPNLPWCKSAANITFAKLWQSFAQKQENSAITTFALGAKLCKVHIYNIFAQRKFYANSFFRPGAWIFVTIYGNANSF